MGPTTKFLRRHLHHHRRRIASSMQTFQSPNPTLISFSFYSPILFSRSQQFKPSLNTNPNFSSSRSFSWTPWSRSSNNSVGSENASNESSSGSEFSPIEESSSTGAGNSGVFEDEESKCSDNESGLSSVIGSETGLEVANLEDNPWYSPFRESLMWMMDEIHDLTGLPWWLVISASTLAFRLSLFPVLIFQLKKMGRIAELMPKLPPPFPPPLSGRSFREQYLLFQKRRRELGCPSYLWSFAFLCIQFPCFLLGMTTIRRMCLDHHSGFDSVSVKRLSCLSAIFWIAWPFLFDGIVGGTLWFQNLTDFPHGLLGSTFPILIAGLHYVNVQISFRNFKPEAMPGIIGLLAKYYKLYLDVLAIPLLFIGFFIPQGSLVYWVTNSSLTLIQLSSLKNPYIRNVLGLAPEKVMKKKVSSEPFMLENGDTLQREIPAETLSPEKLLDISLEYLTVGHQDKALPLLRIATKKDPEMVRALVAMGQILCSKKSFDEAAECFECAISKIRLEEQNGLLVLAIFGAGVSRIWQGRKPEGIQHLKRIAELKVPDDPMDKACYYKGLVMLGSELFGDGEKTEAAKYLRIAATYDPGVTAYLKECEEGDPPNFTTQFGSAIGCHMARNGRKFEKSEIFKRQSDRRMRHKFGSRPINRLKLLLHGIGGSLILYMFAPSVWTM